MSENSTTDTSGRPAWMDPPPHPCELPPRRGIAKFYQCPDCRASWTINPTVLRWYRWR